MTHSRSDLDEDAARAGAPDVLRADAATDARLQTLDRPQSPREPTTRGTGRPPDRERDAFEPALTYRPYLDGLRFVAVYLVVAFHTGLPGFSGAFIGVDVFFVLSGYLVTRILIRDIVGNDRVDFGRFYARRFRRILPAAATVLVLAGIAYALVATPLQVADTVGGFRASFWYVANWHFISQSTDYFAPTVAASPVLHFWSLAVEEQFYLLWPLLLGGLYVVSRRAGRWRWSALRVMVLAIAALSLVSALRTGASNLSRAYYGTDTRAYQLLAGALIALTPQLVSLGKGHARAARRTARRTATISLAALLVLGSSLLHMSAITRGVWVVAAAGALIVALERANTGGVADMLANDRVAYLGRISYGTYLWHWPIIVLLTLDRHVASVPLFAITVVSATLLAAISAHVIEHPIRGAKSLNSRSRIVIVVALCISLTFGFFISPLMQHIVDRNAHVEAKSINAPAVHVTKSNAPLDWRKARDDIPTYPECLGRPIDNCILVHGKGKRVLLMGDSVAGMWLPAYKAIAERESLTLAVAIHPACPWQEHIEGMSSPKHCAPNREDWYGRVIPEFDPDIVVLANRPYDAPGNIFGVKVSGHTVSVENPVGLREITDKTRSTIDDLKRPGRDVVLMEPTPLPPDAVYDPLSCISTGSTDCSFTTSTAITPLTQLDRDVAKSSSVWSVDADRLACPRLPVCDPVVNGIIVRRDHTHLTATYVLALTDSLEAILQRDHIL